jgi:hypothetical protein
MMVIFQSTFSASMIESAALISINTSMAAQRGRGRGASAYGDRFCVAAHELVK